MSFLIIEVSGTYVAGTGLRFGLELNRTHSFTSPTCDEPLLAVDALD